MTTCIHEYPFGALFLINSEFVRRSICRNCKRTKVITEREYPAVVIVFRLKEGTNTSFVVMPEIESLGILKSLNAGCQDYEFITSVWGSQAVMAAFHVDDRIEHWHTEER